MSVLDPRRPGHAILGWILVLGPTVITLAGLQMFDQRFYLMIAGLAAVLAAMGAIFLHASYRRHRDDRLLRRQTLLALLVLCIPLTTIFTSVFGSRTVLVELGVLAGVWLAVVFSAWLAVSFLIEDHRSRGGAAGPQAALQFDELRLNTAAAFMLATLLPLLMIDAVDYFQRGADPSITQRSVWMHLLVFGAALLVIGWWVGSAFLRRSLAAAFGITALLSLPLFHLGPQAMLELSIVPVPQTGDALAVAACVPLIVALLYWWLRTPPADVREGFCAGFVVGAIPGFTIGGTVAALMTWIPTLRDMLEATGAPPALRGSVVVDDVVHALAYTQLFTLGPALLLGLLGMVRAVQSEAPATPSETEAAPPPLQALLVATGLLWVANTVAVAGIVNGLAKWADTFLVVPPLPPVVVEWLGIFPVAACFLIAFSILMYRTWRNPAPQPLVLHLLLGLGAVAVSGLAYLIHPGFLPLLSIYGALLGGSFCVLTVARRVRLGPPVPEDKSWGQRVDEALAFTLVAGTATITFSFAAPTMVLAYLFVKNGEMLDYLRNHLAPPPEAAVLPAIQTLADLWIYIFGLWALATMLWMTVAAIYIVIVGAAHHAGQPADEIAPVKM